jgi:hypothetical protein
MKAYIAREERWPVYRVYKPGDEPDDALPVDLPDEPAPFTPGFLQVQEMNDGLQEALAEYYKDAESHIRALYDGLMETVHQSPDIGEYLTPCCGFTPYELPRNHRMTNDPDLVTCTGGYPDCSEMPDEPPVQGNRPRRREYPVAHGPRCSGHLRNAFWVATEVRPQWTPSASSGYLDVKKEYL